MDPMLYLQKVRNHFVNQAGEYEYFLQTFQDFKAHKIYTNHLIKRLTKLFQRHNTLIPGFNQFLPQQYKIIPNEQDDEALAFVKRVETTFKNKRKAFFNFLGILDMYMRKDISIIKVYNKISDLFCDHQELFLEFKNFLPDTNAKRPISPPLDIIHAKKKRKIEEKSAEKRVCSKELSFFDKVKATLRNSDISQELTKCVELYDKEIISRQELRELVDDLIGEYPEIVKGFNEFLGHSEKNRNSNNICSSNSIEDLDLSKWEEITPSYRLLPMSYQNIGATNNGNILNNECKWVAPKIGKFKHRKKNTYVKKMFKCEDEMFELDMKLQPIIGTLESATKLLKEIEANPGLGKNLSISLESHFAESNLRCIKKLFADREPKILESLSENAEIILPIVLDRLKLEEKELKELSVTRQDSEKGWKKTFADNHRQALGLPKEIIQ